MEKSRSHTTDPEQELEEAVLGRPIPSVRPIGDDELPMPPPPKQSYRRSLLASLRELWDRRELVYTLTERDIRVRYRQAVLGAAWALLTPIALMVIFSLVFGRVAGITPPGGVPYPLFSYVALVPWALFSGTIGNAATSAVANSPIVRKVYCPREVFPVAGALSAGFDFLASSLVLLGMLVAYGFYPRLTWLAVPGLLLILLLLAAALGMLVWIVTLFYRDMRHGVPLLVQVLLFASPVAYPLQRITESSFPPVVKTLYVYANPFTPIIDGLRRSVLFGQWPEAGPTVAAAGIALGLAVVSYWIFKRRDALISDIA